MSDVSKKNSQDQEIKYHVPADLEYCYRDVFNVFVRAGDVVIEFGNSYHGMPGHVSIKNRVVITVAGAYQLNHTLQQVLQAAQEKMKESLEKKTT